MVSPSATPPEAPPVKHAMSDAGGKEPQQAADVIRLRVSFKGRFTQVRRALGSGWRGAPRQFQGLPPRRRRPALAAPPAQHRAAPAPAPAGRRRRLALPGRRPLPGERAGQHPLRRPHVQPCRKGGRRGVGEVPATWRGAGPRLPHQRERRQRRQGGCCLGRRQACVGGGVQAARARTRASEAPPRAAAVCCVRVRRPAPLPALQTRPAHLIPSR